MNICNAKNDVDFRVESLKAALDKIREVFHKKIDEKERDICG